MQKIIAFSHSLQNFSYTGYCQSGAYEYGIMMVLHLGTLVFIISKITKEYSWADRLWPILPIFICIHFFIYQTQCDQYKITLRQWIMFGCITIWGLRLTYNFYRKGGFSKGGEDYRWKQIKKTCHWSVFELFNFFFISYYQLVLIFLFTAPVYLSSNLYFNIYDIALTAIWVILFVGEVIADEQQWEFQTKKYALLKQHNNNINEIPAPYNSGFVQEGLWKYSRHPNFFCEITMWWVIFAFSVSSQGMNYSWIGAVLLTLLFQGSTGFTQLLSSRKYPEYKEYKRRTSMLIPMPAGKKLKPE